MGNYSREDIIQGRILIKEIWWMENVWYHNVFWTKIIITIQCAGRGLPAWQWRRDRDLHFFSRDFNLVASAVNEHWHQQQYVLKIVFFPRLWMFFSIYFRFFFLPFMILLRYYFFFFCGTDDCHLCNINDPRHGLRTHEG